MIYITEATQALSTNIVPDPPRSKVFGDTIFHRFAQQKDTKLMQWAFDFFGEELIDERNDFGDTLLHQLVQGDLSSIDEMLKIIEMCKRFLGEGFKEYVAIRNNKKKTAYDLARVNHADPEVIKRLNPEIISVEEDTPAPRVTLALDQPPRSDTHDDTFLAIFCYKGDLPKCEWFCSYFGNNKEEVMHQNRNKENALHQLFKATDFNAVANSIRLEIIIVVRKHILNTWGAATYKELLAQENNFSSSVLSLAIENGGDVKVVKELLAGMSPDDQSFIIETKNENGDSPLDFARGNEEILDFLNDILQKEKVLTTVEVDLETDEEEQTATDESLPLVENIISNVIEPEYQREHEVRDKEMLKLLKELEKEKKKNAILEKKEKRLQRKLDEVEERELAEAREREVQRVRKAKRRRMIKLDQE